jgi:hypothetical protein
MRALRRVVDAGPRRRPGRRAAAAGLVIAAAACVAAGCANFNSALGKQEAVVTFSPGTSQAAMMKVRSACSGVPGAHPEAVPPGANATSGLYDVRFQINQASDTDIAKLESCLSRFHSVRGINIEQQGGD